MNWKKHRRVLSSLMVFAATAGLMGQEPVLTLGESHYSAATGPGNGRRVARTLHDRVVVVWTDSTDYGFQVVWTETLDSDQWREPEVLAAGRNPTVAVFQNHDIYLAWAAPEGVRVARLGETDAHWSDSFLLNDDSEGPALEVGSWGVQVATAGENGLINHYLLDHGLTVELAQDVLGFPEYAHSSVLGPPVITNEIQAYGIMPTVLMWSVYDSLITNTRMLLWVLGDSEADNRAMNAALNLSSGTRPSLVSDLNTVFAAYVRPHQIMLPAFWYSQGAIEGLKVDSIATDAYWPRVHIDNPIGPEETYALVYEDSSRLYYTQMNYRDGRTPSVRPGDNGDDSVVQGWPSVCYRSFRPTFFDVVWTEGVSAPFQIKFQRYPKTVPNAYGFLSFTHFHMDQNVHFEKEIMTQPFFNCHIYQGQLPPGLALDTTSNVIRGTPFCGGTYEVTLQGWDSYEWMWVRKPFYFHVSGDTCAVDAETVLPRNVQLLQNYPNPFNPATTLVYELPGPARVQLGVFNMVGQCVGRLVDEIKSAGRHQAIWFADAFPSGLYLVCMQAGDTVATRKVMLLK